MNLPLTLILSAILLGHSACAAAGRVQSAKPTFLEDVDVTKRLESMPFDHSWVWIESEDENKEYHSVMLQPVRLDRLDQEGWQKSISPFVLSKNDYDQKAAEVASYFREQLEKQIRETPDARLKITEEAGPGVLLLELAFTELEFSHPLPHAAAIAVPLPGATQVVATVTDPHAAFALRITDSQTNALIATVADTRYPPIRIFDLNKATITSSIREICSNWSIELASAIHQGKLGEVERLGIFKLLPW